MFAIRTSHISVGLTCGDFHLRIALVQLNAFCVAVEPQVFVRMVADALRLVKDFAAITVANLWDFYKGTKSRSANIVHRGRDCA